MNAAAILIVIGQLTAGGPAYDEPLPTCDGMNLRPEVEQRIVPILEARIKARKLNDWYLPEYTEPLHQLFREDSPIAMESRIALLAYYIGEAYGEELFCAISQDGEDALPLLEQYQVCRPGTALDPKAAELVTGQAKYEFVAEFIREGKTCDLHE